MSLMKDIPLVEWMPLDGLAQQWATFAAHSTRPRAFAAVSLAFTALKQETEARHLEQRACHTTAQAQAALLLAFEPLQQAASSWLSALEQVDEYHRYDLFKEEEQSEQAVRALQADSYEHLLYVACLLVRLVQKLYQVLDEPLRVVLCPIEMLDQEGQP